jgi:hypothetical protein
VEEKKAILLVMDDEEQVILAMRALCRYGIVHEVEEVVIAGDGGEAEWALRDEKANTDRNSRQTLRAPGSDAGLERERDQRAPSGALR